MNPHRTLVTAILFLVILASPRGAADRQVVNPKNFKPHGRPYSPAIRAGNTVYISGQGSMNSDGKLSESFEERVRQCLLNIRSILQGGGLDFENLVAVHVYLTDLATIEPMNRVYWQMIGDSPPARTVLGVAALPGGNTIEINAIAVADARTKRAVWPSGWTRSGNADPPAIQVGELLYLSGVGARHATLSAPYAEQVKSALDNVGTILAAAGMSHKNVLWVNPYLDDIQQYGAMNKVYETYFEFGNTPGRGTIHVNALPAGEHIVFSAIAGQDLSKRRAVKPRNMPPSSTASPGILYGDTLYLSAKAGFIPGQGIVTKDFELQLRQTMRNLLDGLEEADMSFSDVVSAVVYLKNMKDYDAMNQLYRNFFKGDFPSRTTLQQNQDRETQTEEQISIIAVRKEKP